MIGQTVSHYKILEKLGEGGMGVVYKASDTRLDRTVALKFLPEHLLSDPSAKARFIQEAKGASAINHQNITTVYDIGEVDGKSFIAMEYLEGRTVKEIAKENLKLNQVLEIAIQIAEGLAAAHKKGIVHRDIKSENIMVTKDDVVKIMDFGLAKLKGAGKLTETGSTVGTISYMSPEQTKGEEIDYRSDLFSLGVVLYELITGRLPFVGEHNATISYSICFDSPELLARFKSEVPEELQKVVDKTLKKDRAMRYQSAADLAADLKAFRVSAEVAPSSPGEKSIVVLPFENISPDKDNEYFSDGLTEEVIADLSKIHSLRVISRSSAMTLKGTRKTVKTIGKELNVRYVLEGSVRKSGSQLRITAQLIDVASDAHLWAEKYSGTVEDIFDIQEKVSHSIAEALKLKLTTVEKAKLAEHPIVNAQAYDCYLRARYAIHSWKEEELEQALGLLNRALEQVGENALLYASLGYVYFQLVNAGYRQEEYIAKAEESAEKALALDLHSGHAHRLLGIIDSSFKGDQRSGCRHLKEALAGNPYDAESLWWLAVIYALFGKIETGWDFANRLIKIDPLNVTGQLVPGWIHFQDGRFDLAFVPLEKTYQMEPAVPLHRFAYGLALAYSGRVQEAVRLIDVLLRIEPPTFFDRVTLLLLYGLKGEKQLALEQVTEEVRTTAQRDFQWSWHLAAGYAANDEKEKALEWLENAVSRGFINYPMLAKYDPFLETLRAEKRCQQLLERAKYEWEHFEA